MDGLMMKRVLLTAGIGVGVAVSGACLYLLFKEDRSLESDPHAKSSLTSDQTVVRVRVPSKAVGAVIGTGGECVRRLQSDTQTVIYRESPADESADGQQSHGRGCVLVVRGLPENVVRAETAINAIIAEKEQNVSQEFFVPNQAVGAIIGRNGDNIKGMCDVSGARIKVDRTDKKNAGLYTKVVISGTEERIRDAKQLLDDEIRRTENRFSRQKQNNSIKGLTFSRALPIEAAEIERENFLDTYFAKLVPTNSDNDLIPVFVSAVKSPNLFYVQFTGEMGIKLDKLMDETTDFYEIDENRRQTRAKQIKTGDIVAVPYAHDNHWYRARVTSVEENPYATDDCKVGVFYLDYGDEAVVTAQQVCALKDDLLWSMPFQAMECSLAGVRPVGDADWPEDAVKVFEELTHMAVWIEMQARVVVVEAINGKRERNSVQLFEFVANEDNKADSEMTRIDVSQQLVGRGLAVSLDSQSSDSAQ